jgi:hypothetical protein
MRWEPRPEERREEGRHDYGVAPLHVFSCSTWQGTPCHSLPSLSLEHWFYLLYALPAWCHQGVLHLPFFSKDATCFAVQRGRCVKEAPAPSPHSRSRMRDPEVQDGVKRSVLHTRDPSRPYTHQSQRPACQWIPLVGNKRNTSGSFAIRECRSLCHGRRDSRSACSSSSPRSRLAYQRYTCLCSNS